ncbi:MAG: hypothetical protein GY845_30375 [Planctomycetes bacterium]|nr:hypothetical protein [Planctomycetota bacterium]
MAVSTSTDFTLTRDEIIQLALLDIGAIDPGEPVKSKDTEIAAKKLNMMLKAWQAEGIGLWKTSEIALFLEYEGYSYSVGPSGDHAATSYVKTEIATAASSGASAIEVDSITGMTDGDSVGIQLDDDTLQWTTINGAPSGSSVTLTAALTDTVAVDNHVYVYTSKPSRPVDIVDARLHRSDGTDTPLDIKPLKEYNALSDKTSTGQANIIYYDPRITNVKINVWPAANSVADWILLDVRLPVFDLDSASNNADCPAEYLEAIQYNLSTRLAPSYGLPVSVEIKELSYTTKEALKCFDTAHSSYFIEAA